MDEIDAFPFKGNDVLQTFFVSKDGDVVHIFPPGEGFCIGIGNGRHAPSQADFHCILRGEQGAVGLFRGDLGDVAVLAPSAGKIASGTT